MTWASQNRQSPRWSLSFGRTNFRLPQHHNTFLTVPATPRGRVCLIVGGASPYTALWAPWGQVQPIVRGEPPPAATRGQNSLFSLLQNFTFTPSNYFATPWQPSGRPLATPKPTGQHLGSTYIHYQVQNQPPVYSVKGARGRP